MNHSIAFEKLKAEIVNITENSHFDIKKEDKTENGVLRIEALDWKCFT